MRLLSVLAVVTVLATAGCPPKKDPDTPRRQSNANEQPFVPRDRPSAAVEADLRAGKDLVKSGQWKAALKVFRRVAKKHPTDSRPHYYVGVCLINLKRVKAAIAAYRRAVKQKPHFFELWNNLGTALLVGRKPAKAVRALKHAVKLQAKDYSGWLNLGLAHEAAGQLPAAARALERAADLQPSNASTHLALADVLRKLGRHAAALKRYDETTRRQPRSVYAHLGAVMMLAKLGREADALRRLNKVAGLKQSARIFAVRGLILMQFKRYKKAVAAFSAAAKARPGAPAFWLMLGRAQIGAKSYRAADKSLRRAAALGKGRLRTVTFYRAEALRKQGRCRQAKPLYKKFLTVVKSGPLASAAAAHLKRCRR